MLARVLAVICLVSLFEAAFVSIRLSGIGAVAKPGDIWMSVLDLALFVTCIVSGIWYMFAYKGKTDF